jgi:hypothetical protein
MLRSEDRFASANAAMNIQIAAVPNKEDGKRYQNPE